jgi:tetratricopeptide (TPR) repeat protein
VAGFPSLERCADVDALTAEIPPPEDPEVARRVAELDERLIEAQALRKMGKYEASLPIVEAIVQEALPLGYEPLLARAWMLEGELGEKLADYERAIATLERAYELAVKLRMATEAANASRYLAFLIGYRLARREEGLQWAKHAKPLALAAGTDETWADYLNFAGIMADVGGKYEEARAHHEEALTIRERVLGSEHPGLVASLNNLGVVAYEQDKFDEAHGYHARALAIYDKTLGPDHPYVAICLMGLGVVAHDLGELEQARGYYERVLSIREQALGPDHPEVSDALSNLGIVAKEQGNYEEALRYQDRVLAIREKALGPEHPQVADTLANLGHIAYEREKLTEARGYCERSLAIYEKALGPDHPSVMEALVELSDVLIDLDEPTQALPHLERALSLGSVNETTPDSLANIRFALARALWAAPPDAGQDRVRARQLAELARGVFAEAGKRSAKQLDEVEVWLAEIDG